MVHIRVIVVALLSVAIAAFAVDCQATMAAEQAALCCKSMDCPSHGQQSEHCCKIMPSSHTPFVQTSVHDLAFPFAAVATVSASDGFPQTSSFLVVPVQSHAPPILPPPSQTPIRI